MEIRDEPIKYGAKSVRDQHNCATRPKASGKLAKSLYLNFVHTISVNLMWCYILAHILNRHPKKFCKAQNFFCMGIFQMLKNN
jgi:hypothetical protein